ncbi:hypothetical protein RhiJN_24066 [Ceratobasidium sp. AG-Ba]|nr:hypothetical protein RhiJN_24066 [Ceratobasidium sp. AG-Ba]
MSHVLELPLIAVIGGQSAGKSSLIEALCQIKLPRSMGTCTRCPIECQSSYADHPWSARVYLMKAESEDQGRSRWSSEIQFGDSMEDPDQLEERIKQAQLAVLHPKTDPAVFLNGDGPKEGGLSFTKNRVIIKVSGDQLADLSFVDLPGIIANAPEKNVGDIELVQRLISSYMKKKSTINLIVITCEADFETQVAGSLARKYDPNGERTIGVITKPDRIEQKQEGQWIPLVTGKVHPLAHGWFCTKQPSTVEREQGYLWPDARNLEQNYFKTAPGWSSVSGQHRLQLGTNYLASKLGQVLTTEVEKCLPVIRLEIAKLYEQNKAEQRKLPQLPPHGPRDLIQQLVTTFVRGAEKKLIKGDPNAGSEGVVQTTSRLNNEMRQELQWGAPVFLPDEKGSRENQLPRPSFLPIDEKWLIKSPCENEYTVSDVAKHAIGARTREWPGHYPFEVMLYFTAQFVNKWSDPVNRCFEQIVKCFETQLLELVNCHFGPYRHGGLLDEARQIVLELAEKCKGSTLQLLEQCIDQEAHPESTHEEHYQIYEAQFADYYRSFFSSTNGFDQFAQVLETGGNPEMTAAITLLEGLGLPSMSSGEWRALYPIDASHRDVLRIMSSVRAHYQIAFKRFSDKVKDTVNQSYTYAFGNEVEIALRRGLQLNKADAPEEYFADLIVESEEVEILRAILQDKEKKLHDAKMKLA